MAVPGIAGVSPAGGQGSGRDGRDPGGVHWGVRAWGCRSLLCAALLLTACAAPLDTTYGATKGSSINGLRVFKAEVDARFKPITSGGLSARIDEATTLIHVSAVGELPSERVIDHLDTWLNEVDGRQVLMVLADGDATAYLGRRWAGEARTEAARATTPADGARLTTLAGRLDELVDQHRPPRCLRPGQYESTLLFDASGRIPSVPTTVTDAHGTTLAVPPTLELGIELTDPNGTALIEADDLPLLYEVQVGGSRLLLVPTATFLLDGTLAHPAARALAGRVLDEVAKPGAGDTVWVMRLWVDDGDPQPPSMLAMLFTHPPISWVVWHLLAVAALLTWWRWAWLGRRETRPAGNALRFRRHLVALGQHLKHTNASAQVTKALSDASSDPATPRPRDPATKTL